MYTAKEAQAEAAHTMHTQEGSNFWGGMPQLVGVRLLVPNLVPRQGCELTASVPQKAEGSEERICEHHPGKMRFLLL